MRTIYYFIDLFCHLSIHSSNKSNSIFAFISQLRREEWQDTNIQAEETNGIRCNFETKCNWEWDKTQNDTFHVVNMHNVTDAKSFVSSPGRPIENRGK